jgi:hypothetical protein
MAMLRPAHAAVLTRGWTAPCPNFEALVGEFGWRRLHPHIKRRFSEGGQEAVTYPGRLDVTRNWAGVAFALAAKAFGGPLPISAASDAGALVCVRSNGNGGVIWERWLELRRGAPPLRIASTKQVDDSGHLLECVEGGLGMVLRVFEQNHGLVFESQSYFLTLLRRRLPLPHWLTPGICRVAHHHVAAGQFRFEMTIDHPLFGRTFSQSGIFIDAGA